MKRLILALSTVLLLNYACVNFNSRVEAQSHLQFGATNVEIPANCTKLSFYVDMPLLSISCVYKTGEMAVASFNTKQVFVENPTTVPPQTDKAPRWAEVAPSQFGPWVRVYTGIQLPNAYWTRDVELGVPVTEPKWMMR